jgi:hypothetical protein
MKRYLSALSLLLLVLPFKALIAENLVPAGSLIQCTVSEPKLSSKTASVGDPVLCQVSHVEVYGRSVFPYHSYMVGRFEDYKDPGHFVGKGWMELKFDRMIVQPDQVIPIEARVVAVPGYNVDHDGRILGKGHAVRDTVEWMVPVLWPIDLLNLPRRGPRPVLKEETRLTLKVMDDIGVPQIQQQEHDEYGFAHRTPTSYEAPAASAPAPAAAPAAPLPQPIAYSYVPPAPTVIQVQSAPTPPPTVVQVQSPPPAPAVVQVQSAPPPVTVLVLRNGYGLYTTGYWPVGGYQIRYIAMNGYPAFLPMSELDMAATYEANRRRGVNFYLPGYGAGY